jgi:hypothetical protein
MPTVSDDSTILVTYEGPDSEITVAGVVYPAGVEVPISEQLYHEQMSAGAWGTYPEWHHHWRHETEDRGGGR